LQIIHLELARMVLNAGFAGRLLTCVYFLSRFSTSQIYNDKQSVFYQLEMCLRCVTKFRVGDVPQ